MDPAEGTPYRTDCRHFGGYKPCRPDRRDCRDCPDHAPRGHRILLINLDSMGDVLRTTAVLPPLKRRHPVSHLTWVTLPRAAPLLERNPLVDRILPADASLPFILAALEFDSAYNVDKGLPSAAMLETARAAEKKGFGLSPGGAVVPVNPEAEELFLLGLDNHRKFFLNRKSELQLLAEAFGLEYRHDPYLFRFSPEEERLLEETRRRLGLEGAPVVLGVNTGCSHLYANKKLPLAHQETIIRRVKQARPGWPVVLLGGVEDGERNRFLAERLEGLALETPTDQGLRRGMIYTALADVVFTGDSLGMHMAIALGKRIVSWFGLTCEAEIELFGRGEKLLARVDCRPCWQRFCDRPVLCYDRLDHDEAVEAILRQGDLAAAQRGAPSPGPWPPAGD
jgi:heptosyltransferase-2